MRENPIAIVIDVSSECSGIECRRIVAIQLIILDLF